ncbi:MAG: outer membrane lipoprotein chaperone LolA [Gammaproteobacteria bacterium]|nr:outer membrane lipoprotein chaperone LolA [Gammaproteobacteria bacterium]MDH3749697.1 outer membrane lipoprotein chaperone LolA [Gammaproteobacteria bacterium]MDH3805905.1 outer membrane lipoprotein chaperone LolA [Gammaproteobacteria bacterium]
MNRQHTTIAMLFLMAASAFGEASSDDAGKRLVDEFVDDVVTFQGSFEQSLIDADGQVVENTIGMLEIQRPGQFRWSYIEPYEQWLVADGVNIWSYDVDLAQVTVKPQAEALANTPALLLGGSAGALDQFEYQGSYVETATTWVRLVPKDTASGFERVELGFVADTLSRMVFFDNLEQTTLVQLYEVAVNEPINPDRFEFVVPEDVDVVGVPAVVDTMAP